jgi:hypothetical protein
VDSFAVLELVTWPPASSRLALGWLSTSFGLALAHLLLATKTLSFLLHTYMHTYVRLNISCTTEKLTFGIKGFVFSCAFSF